MTQEGDVHAAIHIQVPNHVGHSLASQLAKTRGMLGSSEAYIIALLESDQVEGTVLLQSVVNALEAFPISILWAVSILVGHAPPVQIVCDNLGCKRALPLSPSLSQKCTLKWPEAFGSHAV